jgi:alkylated DNA repair protein alkB family protein 6
MAKETTSQSLHQQRIPDLPQAMFYIPNFIREDEEQRILEKVQLTSSHAHSFLALSHTHQIPANRWITLTHRRLQAIPAQLTANNTLLASTSMPPWLIKPVVDRISSLGIFEEAPHGINHCLINEYLPGQGIMPHEDGDAYFPVVATVSLGGSLVLDVTERRKTDGESAPEHRKEPKRWRVLQEPGSLLLTTGDAYTDTLHGIAEITEDLDLGPETIANWELLGNRGAIEANGGRNARIDRVSLTYRDVKKVSKVASKLFGKTR